MGPDAGVWFRLTDRDRLIVGLLAEHDVATTDQLTDVAFGSVRRAQDRLSRLCAMGVLFRFRFSLAAGGTSPAHYTLGYTGARLVAARRAVAPPRPATWALRVERLAESPRLRHRLGVNGFFTDLAAYARAHPDRVTGPDGIGGLTTWWSERAATGFFWTSHGGRDVRLRPDGYGCWEHHSAGPGAGAGGGVVRFFLEHDNGTEPHADLVGKLATYTDFPTHHFGILAFTVPGARRETNLHRALTRALGRTRPRLPIATMPRDHGHPDGPAGPVWALWHPQPGPVQHRYRLHELPTHGPTVAHHPPLVGQPFSEAAFDPDDTDMVNLTYH